jgi:hypothetical protein
VTLQEIGYRLAEQKLLPSMLVAASADVRWWEQRLTLVEAAHRMASERGADTTATAQRVKEVREILAAMRADAISINRRLAR